MSTDRLAELRAMAAELHEVYALPVLVAAIEAALWADHGHLLRNGAQFKCRTCYRRAVKVAAALANTCECCAGTMRQGSPFRSCCREGEHRLLAFALGALGQEGIQRADALHLGDAEAGAVDGVEPEQR